MLRGAPFRVESDCELSSGPNRFIPGKVKNAVHECSLQAMCQTLIAVFDLNEPTKLQVQQERLGWPESRGEVGWDESSV